MFRRFLGKYRFSRPIDEIVARHEIELGREAKYQEVFERTHKKKGTDLYVSTRSQEVVEAYTRQITDKYGEDIDQEPVIDCEAWIVAAGPPKKGRVYGFGESLDSSHVLPSSQGLCSASSRTFVATIVAAESESRVEHMMDDMEARISQRLHSEITDTVQPQLTHTVQTVIGMMTSYFNQLQMPPRCPSSSNRAPHSH
ncbi:hypothetical protein Taro_043120, partial [Colocasia esculenta]|nr:hypothetical protein [Colocasia esculenta]